MQIKELGELGLVKKLTEQFAPGHPRVVKGIGDDASVTIQDDSQYLLCTTDTLVEDIHFSLQYTPYYNLGRKAVSISLSDIAAMGGTPMFLFTSIILPPATPIDFINLLYKGIKEKALEFDVALIGGNTSASSDKIIINTTILGEVPKDQVIFRKGASVGNGIYITGRLGDSSLGLKMWKKKDKKTVTDPFLKDAMLAHIDPSPRVKEGRAIAKKKLATSMIDVSDGLISDLRHIAEESRVGAQIWLKKLPLSTGLKKWLSDHPQDIALALSGGEDYELLFTAPKGNAPQIDALSSELDIPITQIGEIVPEGCGITVLDEKGDIFHLATEGFEHFKTE
ncbi:MAG: thiamine-phosphate kinase [Deltaproteobacteria bacterium]